MGTHRFAGDRVPQTAAAWAGRPEERPEQDLCHRHAEGGEPGLLAERLAHRSLQNRELALRDPDFVPPTARTLGYSLGNRLKAFLAVGASTHIN